jgi:hypothetical protein
MLKARKFAELTLKCAALLDNAAPDRGIHLIFQFREFVD